MARLIQPLKEGTFPQLIFRYSFDNISMLRIFSLIFVYESFFIHSNSACHLRRYHALKSSSRWLRHVSDPPSLFSTYETNSLRCLAVNFSERFESSIDLSLSSVKCCLFRGPVPDISLSSHLSGSSTPTHSYPYPF